MKTIFIHTFLSLVTVSIISAVSGADMTTNEERLAYFLLNNSIYSSKVRPVRRYKDVVNVKHALEVTQLIKLDEKNQVITTSALIKVQWRDEYLKWTPSQFNDITALNIDVKHVWFPTIELFNSAEDGLNTEAIPSVQVNQNGDVDAVVPKILMSTCSIKVKDFPFDSQVCTLSFGSFQYQVKQMMITPLKPQVNMEQFQAHAEWDITETSVSTQSVYHGFSTNKEFSCVSYKITLHRKPLYYVYNFIMPCLLITLITVLLFLIPPQTGERMAVGVTILLSLAVFFLLLEQKMPETSDSVPLIGKYFACTIAEISIAVGVICCVLILHHHEPVDVPRWMRKYILGYLAKILAIKTSMNPRGSVFNGLFEDPEQDIENIIARKYIEIWRRRIVLIKNERLKEITLQNDKQCRRRSMTSKRTLSNSTETMVTDVEESEEEKEYSDDIESKYVAATSQGKEPQGAEANGPAETDTQLEGKSKNDLEEWVTEKEKDLSTPARKMPLLMPMSKIEEDVEEVSISNQKTVRKPGKIVNRNSFTFSDETKSVKYNKSDLVPLEGYNRLYLEQEKIRNEKEEKSLKILADNVRENMLLKSKQDEWKMVAKVVNYFFMWIFILAIILTFFICFGPVMIRRDNGIW